jgi:lipopolysaccharide transport protein LptA
MIAVALLFLGAEPLSSNRVQNDSRPIDMTSSGGLSIDLKQHIGIAKGDVVIRREDVLVCCDEAEARYAGSKIERVTCRGRVVIVRPSGTRAMAHVAVFNAGEDRLTLTGDARVYSEEANLAGERIVYDIGRDHLEVEGGRPQFKYRPDPKQDKEIAARPCPPPGVTLTSPPTAGPKGKSRDEDRGSSRSVGEAPKNP